MKRLAEELRVYLKATDIQGLLNASEEELRTFMTLHSGEILGPCIGTRYIPEDLQTAFRAGKAADVDIVLCAADGDYGEWFMADGAEKAERELDDLYARLMRHCTDRAALEDRLRERFGSPDSVEAKRYVLEMLLFKARTVALAASQVRGGGKARLLYANSDAIVELFGMNSAFLACAFLGNLKLAERLGTVLDKDISEIAQQMLHNFAQTGDPSVTAGDLDNVGEILWPVYDGTENTVLTLKYRFRTGDCAALFEGMAALMPYFDFFNANGD